MKLNRNVLSETCFGGALTQCATALTKNFSVLIKAGIITISDRASTGQYEDTAGPALAKAVEQLGWTLIERCTVPDDKRQIQEAVNSLEQRGCKLILTTGGTGISHRDVTPEALREIMHVELPGFGETMRSESMKLTKNAILSRSLAAVVGRAIVIALPGKPSGAVECLGFVAGAIPHAVALVSGEPTTC